MAEAWIVSLPQQFHDRQACTFAVVLKETSELIGCIILLLNMTHRRGELGYWIGQPFWNHGYCSEAAHIILDYVFLVLGLHRIQGQCMTRNLVSGRVMQKIGMRHEGSLRQHMQKRGQFEDVELYVILKQEWMEI